MQYTLRVHLRGSSEEAITSLFIIEFLSRFPAFRSPSKGPQLFLSPHIFSFLSLPLPFVSTLQLAPLQRAAPMHVWAETEGVVLSGLYSMHDTNTQSELEVHLITLESTRSRFSIHPKLLKSCKIRPKFTPSPLG